MSYLSQLPSTIKDYFEILEPVFPRWLEEYIEVPTMLLSASISDSCGICYTALESYNFFFFKFRPFSCRCANSLAFHA